MGRLRLSTVLISINVGLVLLAVVGVALVASNLLQQLADEQGLARVRQAGQIANQEIIRTAQEAAITAQLLAERPTLQRLLQQNDTAAAAVFLEQFQQTGQLDGCAVIRNGQVVVASSGQLIAEAALQSQGETSAGVVALDGAQSLVLSAGAPLASDPQARVVVIRALNPGFASQLSDDIGLPVAIDTLAATRLQSDDASRVEALRSGTLVTTHQEDQGLYSAIYPLRSTAGVLVGFVEVTLPTTSVNIQLQQLTRLLLLLALVVAIFAALGSIGIGRWLVAPLTGLSMAARRIGRGDLATPVPMFQGAESGALASTLEEMRQRLLKLTADLQQQRAEAFAIVTGISEGIFSVDRERRIRYITPQAEAILGINRNEALGRFCGDVLNPQGPDGQRPCAEHCPIIHARFRDGARATEHLLLPNGDRRTIMITSAAPVEDQQVQVLRDETEVEATRRLRDAVLGNISHEFRTPLSAQLASIELLLDQLPNLTQQQIGGLIKAQQRGTLRLARMIDNLLESVRIEAGHQSIRRQIVALDEVVEAALELMWPLIQQRGQEVAIDLPYPLPHVWGDAQRLTQVFVNLLANANKFAPEGSIIAVSGAVVGSSVTIGVEDTGPGLPPISHRALFSRFVRAPAEEPEQSGIGLGLAIVESIVERHGGHVHAQSTSAGTRMTVELPVASADTKESHTSGGKTDENSDRRR